ncbi:hypothetical protein [Cellulomonas palmilytica]|uniref:hypothetical protein n=1 Tax=Cellulomonas palmilytica TaxID=2608402 RepID=UPI001F1C2670|nr:hypothetical protein [Cellulomonas palmilytica]UJP40922.1 hypothetical protein F1D97_05485 [Cellulomonas palmilytica]
MSTTIEQQDAVRPDRVGAPGWVRGASLAVGVVLAVVAYVAFLTAAGNGPSCPAIFPPPEGCEPERGLDTIVAIAVPFGAVLGAGVATLAARRLPTAVRVAILVALAAAGVAAVAWTAALRG